MASWDGKAWTTPLPPLDADDNPSTPVLSRPLLALGRGGELFIAWSEDVGSGRDVFVARAAAGAWDKSLGSIGLPIVVGTVNLSELVVDDDGSVRIAWGGSISGEAGAPGGISVWQGSSWNTITPAGAVARISARKDETGAALALQGRPALSVVRLAGNQWQAALTALATESFVYSSLGIGPDHELAVAWVDQNNLLSLARWRGNSWDLRGAAAIAAADYPGGMGDTLMTLDSQGNMWVKWIHYPQVQIHMSNY